MAAFKYRFGCRFASGATYVAAEDDLHPTVPGRNAFYELLQKDKDGNPIKAPEGDWLLPRPDIVEFWVEGPAQRCSVNLLTGKFRVDGASFVHPEMIPVPAGAKLSLVWFRRHRINQNVGLRGEAIGPATESPVEYHVGWRCYLDGRKHEQTLVLT